MNEVAIDFLPCPNHDTNEGWGKLKFVTPDLVRCDLCGKHYNLETIRQLIVERHQLELRDLQRAYALHLARLVEIHEALKAGPIAPETAPEEL